MASNITVDTLTKGSTTLNTDEIVDTNSSQVCKAWVNFNGTGTVAIRDSFNVASITDYGAGKYTVNFTNGFANNNYSAVYIAGMFGNSIDDRMATVWYLRSNAFNVACGDNSDNSYYDCDYNGVQVFSN